MCTDLPSMVAPLYNGTIHSPLLIEGVEIEENLAGGQVEHQQDGLSHQIS